METWNGGKVQRVRPSVVHLMRGQVYEIGGRRFFTMGGASSHDIGDGILDPADPQLKQKCRRLDERGALYRIEHLSWWKEELPGEAEYREARENLAANGLDIYTKAYFTYENALAASKNGLGVKSEGQLIISGTRGYIIVEAPWWKTTSFEVRYEDQSQNEKYFSKFLKDGLRYEVGDFVSAINGFGEKHFKLTKGESITMAGIMEKFMETRHAE